jgi:uncharacterized protein (TIGR02246 family)
MSTRHALLVIGIMFTAFGHAHVQTAAGATTLTALDYAELQRLYPAYAHAYDSCAENGQAFARLFTPDGVFILPNGSKLEGREKLTEFARCPAGMTRRATQHWIGSILISPGPEGATGTAYVMQVNTAEPKLSSSGNRYETVFVKGPQGWAFKKHTVVPTARPPAPTAPQ